MIRTHEAGTLRAAHAGEHVVLAGWVARRRDHGGVVFIDLRDASGVVQVVWRGEEAVGPRPRAEFCVLVTGTVRARPAGNENPGAAHRRDRGRRGRGRGAQRGRPAAVPGRGLGRGQRGRPAASTGTWTSGATTPRARPCGFGSQAAYLLSDVMREHRFVNVETPYLTRSTPEGARDFLVPVRLRPGNWYALPAVAAAVQAAAHGRRAGALLPDRPLLPGRGLPRRPAARVHPARHRDVVRRPRTTSSSVGRGHRDPAVAELVGYQVPTPMPGMTYAEAMARYGSDKPDLRFDAELTDLTDVLRRARRSGCSRRRTWARS